MARAGGKNERYRPEARPTGVESSTSPVVADDRFGADLYLRIVWFGMGVALLLAFPAVHWLPVWGLPWTAGWVALYRGEFRRSEVGWSLATRDPTRRLAVAAGLSSVLLLLWAIAFGAVGTLLIGVWAGAVLLWALPSMAPARVEKFLSPLAAAGVASARALGVTELTLRHPAVQQKFGLPGELARWGERYDRLERANAFGFRTEHETFAKPPGTLRVVALGDSYTWGDKVASSDSIWPARLEKAWNRLVADSIRVEVVNLAKRGFTTFNSAEMLRRVGWQFSPDLVVLQFYVNDILPSVPNFRRENTDWLFPRIRLLPVRLRKGLAGSSHLLFLLEQQLSRGGWGAEPYQKKWRALYASRGPEWRQLRGALEEMGRGASDRRVPIVLILFPQFVPGEWSAGAHPQRAILDQVTEAAREAGFRVLDLTPAFAEQGGDWSRWWATSYDSHPNVAAHRLASRTLLSFLEENGMTSLPVTAGG